MVRFDGHRDRPRWRMIAVARRWVPVLGLVAGSLLVPLPVMAQSGEVAVGTQLAFPMAGSALLVPATCQFVGPRSYVFVEDASWDTNGGSILHAHVGWLGTVLEEATPADGSRGILEQLADVYGEPPDVDGDPRVYVLVADLPQPRAVGFFDPAVSDHAVDELRRDMVYLSERAVRMETYLAKGSLVHVLAILYQWEKDADEDGWVQAGLAGYAEALTGFPEGDEAMVPAFLDRPWTGLAEWQDRSEDFGRTYLLMSFLAERYGSGLLADIVAEPRNGVDGIEAALALAESAPGFVDVWHDWLEANGGYGGGYGALAGRRAKAIDVQELPIEGAQVGAPDKWGASYVAFHTPGSVEVEVLGDGGRYRLSAILWNRGNSIILRPQSDTETSWVFTTGHVDSLALVVGKTSTEGQSVTISARPAADPPTVGTVRSWGEIKAAMAGRSSRLMSIGSGDS